MLDYTILPGYFQPWKRSRHTLYYLVGLLLAHPDSVSTPAPVPSKGYPFSEFSIFHFSIFFALLLLSLSQETTRER